MFGVTARKSLTCCGSARRTRAYYCTYSSTNDYYHYYYYKYYNNYYNYDNPCSYDDSDHVANTTTDNCNDNDTSTDDFTNYDDDNNSGSYYYYPISCDNGRPLPIDPRLGTTPPSAAIKLPPISGYSAPLPTSDSAVKFPRSRRNVNNKKMKIIPDVFNIIKKTDGIHNITKRQSCACVLAGTCIRNVIDIRIVTPPGQCSAGQEYCCGNATDVEPSIISCGVRQEVPSSPVTTAPGQASFGEFPWQGAVITVENYYGGGVLIDGLNVLTVAHKTEFSEIPVNLTVRLGEYDGNTPDPVPYQEYLVSKVIRHPSYNPNTLQNDIAVLRLASAVPFSPTAGSAVTINRACLPPSTTSDYTGQRCLVAGWGFQVFGSEGYIQATIKKVDVPIIDPETCQSLLRTTRLGPNFTLDSASFMCAGGEENKDACTGDGGSGLVCEVDGKWVLVGLVAWGLGCGDANVPGVYVNVATFLPWINEQIAAP
ncbi:unnamed protein product [Arctia plantaginis]|uniref:Peptidase S1 domain-containing protein n=1 Tax=Arctia plantaginis TaxID=874455 RepID=A0A8S1A2M1_ARCPL|nr:unnamed protein product [Arctia plantaginis]